MIPCVKIEIVFLYISPSWIKSSLSFSKFLLIWQKHLSKSFSFGRNISLKLMTKTLIFIKTMLCYYNFELLTPTQFVVYWYHVKIWFDHLKFDISLLIFLKKLPATRSKLLDAIHNFFHSTLCIILWFSCHLHIIQSLSEPLFHL